MRSRRGVAAERVHHWHVSGCTKFWKTLTCGPVLVRLSSRSRSGTSVQETRCLEVMNLGGETSRAPSARWSVITLARGAFRRTATRHHPHRGISDFSLHCSKQVSP